MLLEAYTEKFCSKEEKKIKNNVGRYEYYSD